MVFPVMPMRSATGIGKAPAGTALFRYNPWFSPSMPMTKSVPLGKSTSRLSVFQPVANENALCVNATPNAFLTYTSIVNGPCANTSTLVKRVGSNTENSMSQLSL